MPFRKQSLGTFRRLPRIIAKKTRARRPARLQPTVEMLEERINLSIFNWSGGGDGIHWKDTENWAEQALPGEADDVVIQMNVGALNPDRLTVASVKFSGQNGLTLVGNRGGGPLDVPDLTVTGDFSTTVGLDIDSTCFLQVSGLVQGVCNVSGKLADATLTGLASSTGLTAVLDNIVVENELYLGSSTLVNSTIGPFGRVVGVSSNAAAYGKIEGRLTFDGQYVEYGNYPTLTGNFRFSTNSASNSGPLQPEVDGTGLWNIGLSVIASNTQLTLGQGVLTKNGFGLQFNTGVILLKDRHNTATSDSACGVGANVCEVAIPACKLGWTKWNSGKLPKGGAQTHRGY